MLMQGGLCAALGQALICVTGEGRFRAGRLLVRGWPKHESTTATDCAAVSLVPWLTAPFLLIIPTVFHVFINRHIVLLMFSRSADHVGDQSLGRSPNGFLWSRVT